MLIAHNAIWEHKAAANTVPANPATTTVPTTGWTSGGVAPFGTLGAYVSEYPVGTAWAEDTGLWLRRGVTVDGEHGLLLRGRINRTFYLYFDGVYVATVNPARAALGGVSDWMAVIPRSLASLGTHTIAMLCLDDATADLDGTTFVYLTADYLPPVIARPARPDVREVIEFMTDAMISKDGTEDRDQIRVHPRQSVGFSIYVPFQDQPRVKNMIWGSSDKQWLVPMWQQTQRLGAVAANLVNLPCETRYSEFRPGSLAMLWESIDSYQIVGIERITSAAELALSNRTSAFADAWLMPVRIGYLDGRAQRAFDGRTSSLSIGYGVEDIGDIQAFDAPTQYLGEDIYYDSPLIEGDTMNEEVDTSMDFFDPGIGLVSYAGAWNFNRPMRLHRMVGDTPAESWAIRQFIYRRAGRYRGFWQPSFEVDMRPTSTGSITTTLTVRADDYLAYSGSRDHIAVETDTGWLPRKINSAIRTGPDAVQLTLDSSLAINASVIQRVCFLGFKRLDTDRAELVWKGEATCSTALATVEIAP